MIFLTLIIYFVYVLNVRYFPPDLMFWLGCSPLANNIFVGGIIVVIVCSDTANDMRGRKDKLIMGCERGGNYKKDVILGSYNMKVKYPFMMRYVPSGGDWKDMVMCWFLNHILSKDLDGNDILGRLKGHERKFVNYMTKYKMAPRYTVAALKYRDP